MVVAFPLRAAIMKSGRRILSPVSLAVFIAISILGWIEFAIGPAQSYATKRVKRNIGIVVPENALGDVVQDGVIDLLDLLRLRDIIHGIAPAPTQYELTEGDLDVSSELDIYDVEMVARILLEVEGPPHIVGDDGGDVAGADVTMTFTPEDIDDEFVMSIVRRVEADIEEVSGADFTLMELDSTYYITGWQLDYSDDSFVYPPEMKIEPDELPPCELQGSNLLMTARRGPLGNTELILLAELEANSDSTLSLPPPPYPEIVISKSSYEPYELLEIVAENISINLVANIIHFDDGLGVQHSTIPVQFLIEETYNEIEGLKVVVPHLPAGNYTLQLEHAGTGLASDLASMEILPLTTPETPPPYADYINTVFARVDSCLVIFRDSPILAQEPFVFIDDLGNQIEESRLAWGELWNEAAVTSDDELQELVVAFERMQLIALADSAIVKINEVSQYGKPLNQSGRRVVAVTGFVATAATTACVAVALGFTGGVGIPLCGYVAFSATTLSLSSAAISVVNEFSDKSAVSSYWGGQNRGGWSTNEKFSDPSYEPKKYPNVCMNIWRHNTNAMGCVGGRYPLTPPPCPPEDPCCTPLAPPCPPDSENKYATCGGRSFSWNVTLLNDAIITPEPGNLHGIVGVVDGAGAFAIPGLPPGQEIHFSVYDPNTGFYDLDAGSAVTPNISEQGVWFPVFLYFDPNTEIQSYGLDFGETAHGDITLDSQRYEFSYLHSSSMGDTLSFGFCAHEPLKLEIRSPSGIMIMDEPDVASVFNLTLPMLEEGVYTVVVAFGMSQLESPFILGYYLKSVYPMNFIGGHPIGPLSDELSPYKVFGDAVILGAESLLVGDGQIIRFPTGTSIRADGMFGGLGSENQPIILSPETRTKVSIR